MCLELNYKEKRKKPLAGGIIISIILRGQDAWVLAVRPTLRLSVRFLQKRGDNVSLRHLIPIIRTKRLWAHNRQHLCPCIISQHCVAAIHQHTQQPEIIADVCVLVLIDPIQVSPRKLKRKFIRKSLCLKCGRAVHFTHKSFDFIRVNFSPRKYLYAVYPPRGAINKVRHARGPTGSKKA